MKRIEWVPLICYLGLAIVGQFILEVWRVDPSTRTSSDALIATFTEVVFGVGMCLTALLVGFWPGLRRDRAPLQRSLEGGVGILVPLVNLWIAKDVLRHRGPALWQKIASVVLYVGGLAGLRAAESSWVSVTDQDLAGLFGLLALLLAYGLMGRMIWLTSERDTAAIVETAS